MLGHSEERKQVARTIGSNTDPVLRQDVRLRLRDLRQALNNEGPRTIGDRTVASLAREWLVGKPQASPGSTREYERIVKVHISPPPFGRLKVAAVSHRDCEALVAAWRKDLSESSAVKCGSVLRQVFKFGCKRGFIVINPVTEVKLPKEAPRVVSKATVSHVEALLAAADPVLQVAIALAFLTGARRSELAALGWFDVNCGRGTIIITSACLRARDNPHGWKSVYTKTSKHRLVAIGDCEWLQLWWNRQRIYAGDTFSGSGFLLSDDGGITPITPSQLADRFSTIAKRAGLEHLSLKSLPHESVSAPHASDIRVTATTAQAAAITRCIYALMLK